MEDSESRMWQRRWQRRNLLKATLAGGILAGLGAACSSKASTPKSSAPSSATTGATASGSSVPKSASGGQAVVSLGSGPDSLFGGAGRLALDVEIFTFIANGLTKLLQPDLTVAPDLADSWTVSPDGTTYTFTLHPGVKWQDGQPFTAADVKFTAEYYASPDYPGSLNPNTALIAGASAYKQKQASEISGIKVIDDLHMQYTLSSPSALFLTNQAGAVLPRHVLASISPADAAKSDFARKPIYTGPFMVDEWKEAESVTFKAFPDHFAGRPRLDRIVGRILPNAAGAIDALRTGEVDMLDGISPDQFGTFARNSAFHTQQLAGTGVSYISFDLTKPPFNDVRVRQAVSYAIDRKAVISALYQGQASPSISLVPPIAWLYNQNVPKFEFDLAHAKQTLDAAGWQVGHDGIRVKDGQRLEFKVVTFTAFEPLAVAIQPMLKSAGMGMQVQALETGTFYSQYKVGSYQMAVTGWINFVIDPRQDLQAHFLTPRATDVSGYNNAQVNQLFAQALGATSRDEEIRLYGQIQQIVASDLVYVYLWRPQDLMASRASLVVPQAKTMAEIWRKAPLWQKGA